MTAKANKKVISKSDDFNLYGLKRLRTKPPFLENHSKCGKLLESLVAESPRNPVADLMLSAVRMYEPEEQILRAGLGAQSEAEISAFALLGSRSTLAGLSKPFRQ